MAEEAGEFDKTEEPTQKRLDEALGHHKVHWHWVKGHAGHAMNERADELAREAIVAARAGAIGAMKTK